MRGGRLVAQACLDGQIAALRGVPFTENPHPLSCAVSRAWSHGHNLITQNTKVAA
jgi:hypothetical protein